MDNLRKLREAMGLSQQKAADQIGLPLTQQRLRNLIRPTQTFYASPSHKPFSFYVIYNIKNTGSGAPTPARRQTAAAAPLETQNGRHP